jgi:hypothetical protein
MDATRFARSCPSIPKFVSSLQRSLTNFGIEGHEQLFESSVALVQKPAYPTRRENDADF